MRLSILFFISLHIVHILGCQNENVVITNNIASQKQFHEGEKANYMDFLMQTTPDYEPFIASQNGGAIAAQDGKILNFDAFGLTLHSNITISQINADGGFDNERCNDIIAMPTPGGKELACIGCSNSLNCYDVTDPNSPVHLNSFAAGPSRWGDSAILPDQCQLFHSTESFNGSTSIPLPAKSRFGIDVFDYCKVDNTGEIELLGQFGHQSGSGITSNHNLNTLFDGSGLHNGEAHNYLYATQDSPGGGGHIYKYKIPADFPTTQPTQVAHEVQSGGLAHDAHMLKYPFGTCANQTILAAFKGIKGFGLFDVSSELQLSETGTLSNFPNQSYTHQGSFHVDNTHQKIYMFINDEWDEKNNIVSSQRTHILDVTDCNNPTYFGEYDSLLPSIDHNNEVLGQYLFQANYTTGLRILKIEDNPTGPTMEELAFIDTHPGANSGSSSNGFDGNWGVNPFLPSGIIAISDISRGLFLLSFTDSDSDGIIDIEDECPQQANPCGTNPPGPEIPPGNTTPGSPNTPSTPQTPSSPSSGGLLVSMPGCNNSLTLTLSIIPMILYLFLMIINKRTL